MWTDAPTLRTYRGEFQEDQSAAAGQGFNDERLLRRILRRQFS